MPLSGVQLIERFNALDQFLIDCAPLWRPRPFYLHSLPWESQHPELATWLRGRSLEQAEAAHNQPYRLAAPAPFPQFAERAEALSQLGQLPERELLPGPARLNVDVPGRKWLQIEAFSSRLHFTQPPTHWLDWCAGKGHLGRRVVTTGQELTCLEHDPALVAAGQLLSERSGIAARHIEQDVMAENAADYLASQQTPVALHACGDLHVRLLKLANTAGCKQLALAPCCYNRTAGEHYRAISRAGTLSRLHLSREDLALPLSETVTAGARVRQQRDKSMARRLAFDLLQRQMRANDDYLHTPSLPSTWLDKPLRDYCQHLADLKNLGPVPEQDWNALALAGVKRLAEVRNLEMVRNLFRRPLEVWLVLDRALYLAEQGYDVSLGEFCPPNLTPRNLLILAEKP